MPLHQQRPQPVVGLGVFRPQGQAVSVEGLGFGQIAGLVKRRRLRIMQVAPFGRWHAQRNTMNSALKFSGNRMNRLGAWQGSASAGLPAL